MLPGTPPDVQAEAEALSAEISKLVPISEDTSNLDPDEPCPACQARVSLADINTAICPNGHRWRKCFNYAFTIAESSLTCTGSVRMTFLYALQHGAPLRRFSWRRLWFGHV